MAHKRPRAAFEESIQKRESPYVFYGTPLPPLDEQTRDDGSYVPLWKQEVTDERGRKRLHGAFTGGFSAGYFNTVGSKEGWAPTAFKSSRKDRAKGKPMTQRPEDFMDDEDVREAEESREISTDASFTGFGLTENDPSQRKAVLDIFKPDVDTIGARLLKKMGWKEGQGIGPKVKREANLDEKRTGADDSPATHLFAPSDPPMISFTRNPSHQGLNLGGDLAEITPFRPQMQTSYDIEEATSRATSSGQDLGMSKRGPKAKKAAFGVGILNDTGSDDEDPYEMGPQISYNRVIGGEKKTSKKKKETIPTVSNPILKNRPVYMSKRAKSKPGFRTCHDGRLPLDGFVLSSELDPFANLDLRDENHLPLKVPEGWVPEKQASGISQKDYLSAAEAAKLSTMDPKARAALLGEAQLPAKSVFDFLSPAARNRIATASGKGDLPQGLGEKPTNVDSEQSGGGSTSRRDTLPFLDIETARLALGRSSSGWMPYGEDLEKRARYRSFLEFRSSDESQAPEQPDGMIWKDWTNEMNEFVRAAQVFKPVSGMMASRFVSSSSHRAPSSSEAQSEEDSMLRQAAAKPEDPAVSAAKMGMFGPLTRSVKPFYPSRLACKRFGVPYCENPTMDTDSDAKGVTPANGARDEALSSSQHPAERSMQLLLPPMSALSATEATAKAGAGESPESKETDVLLGQRPSEEVFKAIFGSDDEDSD